MNPDIDRQPSDTGPLAAYIDPDLISLGRLRLANNLRRALLMPREVEVLETVFASLALADQELRNTGTADADTFASKAAST